MTLMNYIYRVFYFLTHKKKVRFISRFDLVFIFDGRSYSMEYESMVGDYNIELNPNNISLLINDDIKQPLTIVEKKYILQNAIEELNRMGLKVKILGN